jgi:uncharacterized protein YneF (UPF0154 family)
MYPNSDLSAGTLAIIAVVAVACLVFWIGGVFIAARPRRDRTAAMTSLPQRPAVTEASEHKQAA